MPPEPRRSASLPSLRGGLIIASVVLLVCLVSLPKIHAHVQNSNESDAIGTLELLGQCALEQGALEQGALEQGALEQGGLDLCALIEGDAGLRHRLRDARSIGEQRLLLYHGYLFQVRGGQTAPLSLLAWPRGGVAAGRHAFAWSAARGLLAMPLGGRGTPAPLLGGDLPALSDGQWSQLEAR